LHVVHQYPPDFRGGTEYYTQTLAAAQARQGHYVAVFVPTPHEYPPTSAAKDEQGVLMYRVPVGDRTRGQVFWQTFRQPELQKAWREVLAEFAPDLVHIQHLMGLPMASVRQELRTAAVPYVVTLHDYYYLCANAQLVTNTDGTICAGPDERANNCAHCALARTSLPATGWLAPGLAPLMRHRNVETSRVLKQAARVIAPTEFVARIYAPLGLDADRLAVVPHGIDLPWAEIAAARRLREARPAGGRLHIGYVGSINQQKGLHVLIEAVKRLPRDRVALTIYGDLTSFPGYVGELRQAAAQSSITFAGPVSRDRLWTAMSDFDVMVMPTLWYEASPLVIDEAFALGVPIVASRIGAIPDKITDGLNGRLFPPGDATALAAILADLQRNPDQVKQWEEGIPTVQEIDAHMKAVEEVYAAALDSV